MPRRVLSRGSNFASQYSPRTTANGEHQSDRLLRLRSPPGGHRGHNAGHRGHSGGHGDHVEPMPSQEQQQGLQGQRGRRRRSGVGSEEQAFRLESELFPELQSVLSPVSDPQSSMERGPEPELAASLEQDPEPVSSPESEPEPPTPPDPEPEPEVRRGSPERVARAASPEPASRLARRAKRQRRLHGSRTPVSSDSSGRRAALSARRCLFGPPDHAELTRSLQEEQAAVSRADTLRWNFDFEREEPLEGPWLWQRVAPNGSSQTSQRTP